MLPGHERSLSIMRGSLALIFTLFGALKLFPELSPAEELASNTVSALTLGLLPPALCRILLATAECAIGIGLLVPRLQRPALLCMLGHLAGTFTPFLLFPDETFAVVPLGLTLTGQYILKNVILVSGALVLWSAAEKPRVTAGIAGAATRPSGVAPAVVHLRALSSRPGRPQRVAGPASSALRPPWIRLATPSTRSDDRERDAA